MGVTEIFESEVPCLSGIIDLQKVCQKQTLKFSSETNQFLLYQTLKKVGPFVAQKLISKLVERGEIEWEENWEVENILDFVEEEGKKFYLIKWKGWKNEYNSWEPQENLSCDDLLEAFHLAQKERAPLKRKFFDPEAEMQDSKRKRVDEIFQKLAPLKEKITPLQLLSLSSPKKGKKPLFKGLISSNGRKLPKLNTPGNRQLNPRTKFYKEKKKDVKKALLDWQNHLNSINTDPAPILVENEVDLEGPPENFEYINDYKAGEGIEIPADPLVGCECEDCLDNKKGCCPTESGSTFAYYKGKRLKVPKGTPVYECNKRCKCGPECPNRVVQQGRKCKVCIFRTANGRGWGVKTVQKIKKGTFVVEYVGEVITNEEAEKRGRFYDAVGRTYLFDLDYNDGDCPFTVDAGYYGNVSHFINHSCDPNLEVFGVWINTLDPRLPRIALFARKDIEKGEELTFDYMMTGDTTNQTPIPTIDEVEEKLAKELLNNTKLLQSMAENTDVEKVSNESIDNKLDKLDGDVANSESSDVDVKSESSDIQTIENSESSMNQTVEVLETESSDESGNVGDDEKTTDSDSTITEPVSNTPLLPKSLTDQYRIVCQCGTKNCRKYLF